MKTELSEIFKEIWHMPRNKESLIIPYKKSGKITYDYIQQKIDQSSCFKIQADIIDPDLLWKLSPIGLIMSDTFIMTGIGGKKINLSIENNPNKKIKQEDEDYYRFQAYSYFDENVVKKWLNDAKRFINDGRLLYLPVCSLIKIPKKRNRDFEITDAKCEINQLWNEVTHSVIYRNNCQLLLSEKSDLNFHDVTFDIFPITLPYIKDISLSLLYKVLSEESDAVVRFRKEFSQIVPTYLKKIREEQESELNIKKIGIEMKNDLFEPEIAKLRQCFDTIITKRRTLRMAGASIGIVTIVLSVISPEILKQIIPSGLLGSYLVAKDLANCKEELSSLKENPWFLAWKLKTKSNR